MMVYRVNGCTGYACYASSNWTLWGLARHFPNGMGLCVQRPAVRTVTQARVDPGSWGQVVNSKCKTSRRLQAPAAARRFSESPPLFVFFSRRLGNYLPTPPLYIIDISVSAIDIIFLKEVLVSSFSLWDPPTKGMHSTAFCRYFFTLMHSSSTRF